MNQVKNVSKDKDGHSCPIPLELAKRIIETTTNEGDLVIDPFAGSGTFCLAAKLLKRNYIGIELSEKYCKIAEERIRKTTEPLF